MAKQKITEDQYLKAIFASHGNLSLMRRLFSKELNVDLSRQAIHIRSKKYPNEFASARASYIENAEIAIFEGLDSDNPMVKQRAAEFVLKTVGKHLGYSEKQEIELTTPPTINVNIVN